MTSRDSGRDGDEHEHTALGVEMFCPQCERSFADGLTSCPEDGTTLVRLADRPDPMIGTTLDGRFGIVARLGQGGMGSVYRARQLSVGREVALKVISPDLARDRTAVKRFLREVKHASRLASPSTVGVVDFGQTADGLPWLAMELLDGETLDKTRRASGGRVSVARVARIGLQLCDALSAAHSLGIVHRDLKPGNIMVLKDPPGRDLLKVLDFGLAKSLHGDDSTQTVSGAMIGTPSYMPPELATGQRADARADLYSLGVVLYELACGRLPFTADTVGEMVSHHVTTPPAPPDPSLPPALRTLLLQLLAKDPMDRPVDARAVHEVLDTLRGAAVRDIEAISATMSGAGPLADTLALPPGRPLPQAKTPVPLRAPTPTPTPYVAPLRAPKVMPSPSIAAAVPRSRRGLLIGLLAGAGGILGLAVGFYAMRKPTDEPAVTPDAAVVARPTPTPVAAATPDAATPDAATRPTIFAPPPDAAPAKKDPPRRPKRRPDAGSGFIIP